VKEIIDLIETRRSAEDVANVIEVSSSSTPDLPHAARDRRLLIFVALVFDFINGFHDAANSIATVVSTRVLAPVTRCLAAF